VNPERWKQVERLYHEALERSEEARAAFLASACAGDEELLREVHSLLAYEAEAELFIESPALEAAARLMAREGAAPLNPGQRIRQYEVVSALGAGGMGEVYLARDTRLERRVAIKVLSAESARDPESIRRFLSEAKTASSLNHPNIVTIHEIDQNGEIPFIVMEHIEGESLRGNTGSPMPLEQFLEQAIQMTSAIAAAHEAGIVHRDIKPANVMLSRSGHIKVVDFGLARLCLPVTPLGHEPSPRDSESRITRSGTILGTLGYMSPEQIQGRNADARSDVFALGVLFHEMLSGQRLFAAGDPLSAAASILRDDPPSLRSVRKGVPPELDQLIKRALAKDPDDRNVTASQMHDELVAIRDSLRGGEGTRRRFAFAVAAVAVLLAAAGAAWWWQDSRQSRAGNVALPVPIASQTVFRRLTATGNLDKVTISPDGRFIAYTKEGSLWLRQLTSGEDLQLLPPAPVRFLGSAFTPDGDAIVYATMSANEPRGALHRISTIGGASERLVSGVDSAPAIAPDGKRLAWYRAAFPSPEESALMVANADGSDARVLAVRRRPEQFVPVFFSHPAWSPDGKLIAAAIKRLRDPNSAALIGFDPDNGREVSLSSAHWVSLSSLAWMPDQSGIVAIAAADQASVHGVTHTGKQIWFIPYPSGAPRRITNDFLSYREVSVSADGTKLVADVADAVVHLWSKSLDGDDAPRRISGGHFDGVGGISASNDGRLVFTSTERGTTTLWSMDADGGRRKQLIRNPYREEYPMAFAGGVAYVSSTPGATELCVTSWEGEGRHVVASAIDDAPVAVSPNGDRFAYTVHERLWTTAKSGAPMQLTQEPAMLPAFSPAGDRIAFIAGNLQSGSAALMVLQAGDGKPLWRGPALHPSVNWLRWQPDGQAILLGSWGGQIWRYPLNGEPKRLARFDDMLWSFEPTDANTLVVARGMVTRDAVLITGFR
jgi:Tol biopolymer transport system component/predicted Ser/Thr protein kinase